MNDKKSSTTKREQIVVSSYVVVTKESRHFESQDRVGQVLKLIAINPNIDAKYICVDAFGLYNWGNIGFMNGFGFDNQPKSCCKEVRLATKEEIEAAKGSKIGKEALLEEAKKRYPIGTEIIALSGKVYKISSNSVIQLGMFNPYRICVYDNVSKAIEAVLVVAGENNWIEVVNKEENMSKSVIPPAQEEFFEKKLEETKTSKPTTGKEFFELHKGKTVIARSVIKGIVIGYHKTDPRFVLVKRIDGRGWLGSATQEGQKSKMLDNYIVEYEISQSDKFWALYVDELTVTDNPATTTEPQEAQTKVDLNAILEEAKRRYPAGTTFIGIGINDKCVSDGNAIQWINSKYSDGIANHPGQGLFYGNGKWAEIVELPKTKENMSYIVKQEDLIGKLEGFPIEVVQRMVDYQVEQGNPADVTVFQRRDFADYLNRGFDWVNSSEKTEFWTKVIFGRNFEVFFDRYPKQFLAVVYEPGKIYEFVYRSNCEDVVEFFTDGNKYKGIVSEKGNYIHFSCGPNSISIAISYIERHGLILISESLENNAITEQPTSITLTKEMLSQLPKGSLRHIAKLFGKDYEIIPDSEVIISDIFNAKNNGKSS